MKKSRRQNEPLQGSALRRAGWEALVSGLGLVNATRYIMQSEVGREDYTRMKKSIIEGKSVADLYSDISLFQRTISKKAVDKNIGEVPDTIR